jgi:patatin-like phospholipase/acyl hydrolase
MSGTFKILAIDGGGIRGLLPAMLLAELEERLRRRSGKAGGYLSDCFDLIAGTSAGGILACLYLYHHDGRRYDAGKAVELYEKRGATIFRKRPFRFLIRLFDALYSSKGIDNVLEETFGEARLSDAPCNGAVTAYDITARKAVIFTRDAARRDKNRDYRLRDIARATSSAPTYFRVAEVKPASGLPYPCRLIDGGIYANDPTLCAIVEAKKTMYRDSGTYPKIKDMFVLSLGTGRVSTFYSYESAKRWGLLRWAIPVIDMLQSSGAEVVSYQAAQLFEAEGCPDRYIRIVPDLYNVTHKMDDASPRNIANIKEAANRCIKNNSQLLDEIVEKLLDTTSNNE